MIVLLEGGASVWAVQIVQSLESYICNLVVILGRVSIVLLPARVVH